MRRLLARRRGPQAPALELMKEARVVEFLGDASELARVCTLGPLDGSERVPRVDGRLGASPLGERVRRPAEVVVHVRVIGLARNLG